MTDLQTLLPIVIRYLGFVSLTMLIGGFAFVCLILPPGLLSHEVYQNLERHLRRIQAGSILILALTSVVDLVLRTLTMSGGTLATLGIALPMVLRHTHFGTVWIARILLLGLLGVAWRLRLQEAAASPQFAWTSFFGACFVALTTTLSGHAADWGDVSVPALVDWFHLLAVSIWIGGLFTFGFLLKRSLAMADMEEMVRALSSIARIFSRIAAGCVAIFLLTGLYSAWLQVGELSFVVASAYGWTLLVKLSLMALILMIAAVNRYYFLASLGPRATKHDQLIFRTIQRFTDTPRAATQTGGDRRIHYQFARCVRLEWIIVMIVLACSALLTQLPPARHVRHIEHLKPHEHNGGHSPEHDTPTAMPPPTQR
jgi:putative copper export protein